MAKPNKCEFKTGDYVIFKGYGDDTAGGLEPGEIVEIIEVKEDGTLIVKSLVSDVADTAYFPEEIEEEADNDIVEEILAKRDDEEEQAEKEPAPEPAPEPEPKKTTKAKTTKANTTVKNTTVKNTKKKEVATTEPVDIIDTQAVIEAMEVAGDALSAAQSLAERVNHTFYTLGGVLLHIQRDSLYRQAGYDDPKTGFDDYVSSELGMEYRKARYYMQMYNRFTQLGIEEDIVVSVGWTKARELLRLPDKETTEEGFNYAQEHTRDEVGDYVREQTVTADKSAGKKSATKSTSTSTKATKTTFKFSALEEEGNIIKDALAKAGEQIGSDDVAEQFKFIITEWAAHHGGLDIPLEDAVKNLERLYGVEVDIPAANVEKAPSRKGGK